MNVSQYDLYVNKYDDGFFYLVYSSVRLSTVYATALVYEGCGKPVMIMADYGVAYSTGEPAPAEALKKELEESDEN